jgi:hypothetical protein
MGQGVGVRRRFLIPGLGVGLCLVLLLGVFLAACSSTSTAKTSDVTTAASAAGTTSSASSGVTTAQGGSPGAVPGSSSGAPGGASSTAVYPTKAAYTQSAGTKSEQDQTYSSSEDDRSAILVSDGGSFTATNGDIQTTGDSSSNDSSSFYGLNAAVVATSSSFITLSGGSITTTGSGANGAFATGEGSSVSLSNVTIEAAGGGGHGVMATQGGAVTLDEVKITTAGANSAPLATDRGGGTITATGGSALASGKDSPALYSTGTITVTGGTYEATGAEAAVIEGGNTINLTDVALSSSMADKWGVMIYQSMSGDAAGTQGTFTMRGGSLTYTGANGPLFYVTNSTGVISLAGVQVKCASGVLVKAAAGNWGTSGSNGGTALLTADGQRLTGNLVADNLSSLAITLKNSSSLAGAINPDRSAKEASLALDATSIWIVSADSYLSVLTLSTGISGTSISSIVGNGHTVYYDAANAANSVLSGKTYSLAGGGTLKPMGE